MHVSLFLPLGTSRHRVQHKTKTANLNHESTWCVWRKTSSTLCSLERSKVSLIWTVVQHVPAQLLCSTSGNKTPLALHVVRVDINRVAHHPLFTVRATSITNLILRTIPRVMFGGFVPGNFENNVTNKSAASKLPARSSSPSSSSPSVMFLLFFFCYTSSWSLFPFHVLMFFFCPSFLLSLFPSFLLFFFILDASFFILHSASLILHPWFVILPASYAKG